MKIRACGEHCNFLSDYDFLLLALFLPFALTFGLGRLEATDFDFLGAVFFAFFELFAGFVGFFLGTAFFDLTLADFLFVRFLVAERTAATGFAIKVGRNGLNTDENG